MNFVEGRLLGVETDDIGRSASLSVVDGQGRKSTIQLHGLERLLVTEFRQQNVVEDVTHWVRGQVISGLREAAFFLMTGAAEGQCDPQLALVANNVVDRILRGELEMLEIRAVFGAEVLATFASMIVTSGPARAP